MIAFEEPGTHSAEKEITEIYSQKYVLRNRLGRHSYRALVDTVVKLSAIHISVYIMLQTKPEILKREVQSENDSPPHINEQAQLQAEIGSQSQRIIFKL